MLLFQSWFATLANIVGQSSISLLDSMWCNTSPTIEEQCNLNLLFNLANQERAYGAGPCRGDTETRHQGGLLGDIETTVGTRMGCQVGGQTEKSPLVPSVSVWLREGPSVGVMLESWRARAQGVEAAVAGTGCWEGRRGNCCCGFCWRGVSGPPGGPSQC